MESTVTETPNENYPRQNNKWGFSANSGHFSYSTVVIVPRFTAVGVLS